jgi:hypothetical protein
VVRSPVEGSSTKKNLRPGDLLATLAVTRRFDLTDEQWPRLAPLLPVATKPGRVRADKACNSRANRAYLRRRGIGCTIPPKADQIRHRKNRGTLGRPGLLLFRIDDDAEMIQVFAITWIR